LVKSTINDFDGMSRGESQSSSGYGASSGQVAKQSGAQMSRKLCAVIRSKDFESDYHGGLIRGTNIAFNIPTGKLGSAA
jgi:hypothetical protein